ncbi:hypothetical protein QYE76_027027 [Lolium multiflorum]|uniref:Uncharacterized protein n=1 Tax=Lolium multiflorum TaxID=4521 RepID=A0AAD8QHB3_LOLMU|nr:hypothetical protein QYE76_027027 [Lolium multiflorum]
MEGKAILKDIHEGICGHHASYQAIRVKAFRAGFYWLTVVEDAKEIVKTWEGCQVFAKKPQVLAAEMMPIPLAWPFAEWGPKFCLRSTEPSLYGFLDGSVVEPEKTLKTKYMDGAEVTIPNPEHAWWIAQDQTGLGFLVRNMAKEVLTQMVGLPTSATVWKAVVEMFSAQSQSHVVHLRTKLNQ